MKMFLTGASGDIGTAIKKKFKKEGYKIVCPNEKVLDLSNPACVKKYLKDNKDSFDVIVHCAGYNKPNSVSKLTYADIEKAFNINAGNFFQIVKANIPYFKKKGGHVLAVSSLYGVVGRDGRTPYVVSKHGLNGMLKNFAIELGKFNVKCNTLSPGFVDTKMTRQNNNAKKIKQFESKIPLGKLAKPGDIAEVVFFLCSKNNQYINGQDIIVDGFMAGGFGN
mgnify:FL=1